MGGHSWPFLFAQGQPGRGSQKPTGSLLKVGVLGKSWLAPAARTLGPRVSGGVAMPSTVDTSKGWELEDGTGQAWPEHPPSAGTLLGSPACWTLPRPRNRKEPLREDGCWRLTLSAWGQGHGSRKAAAPALTPSSSSRWLLTGCLPRPALGQGWGLLPAPRLLVTVP